MKNLFKTYLAPRSRFCTLIIYLIGLLSIFLTNASVASSIPLVINCQFPNFIEENGVVRGSILVNVINTSESVLENVLISFSEPSQGFLNGGNRESFHLSPGAIKVLSGDFLLETSNQAVPGSITWSVRYFDGADRGGVVNSPICSG